MLGYVPVFALLAVLAGSPGIHQHGVDLYKQKAYRQAISVLEESAKSEDPQSSEFKESALLIGQSFFMLSQSPQAIPWLEKAPGSPEAEYMLGYAYLQQRQLNLSEAAFARLFNLKVDSAGAHLVAGQMMLKKEFEQDAAAEATKALELDPKLPQAHFILGEIAIYRGRLDEGVAEMQKELALNPNFSMAWYRLGDAYARQERWSEAIPNLQRAVWLNPDFSGPYILLGKCYVKTADYSNAEGILKRALSLDLNNHSANYLLGQTLMAEGKKEEGRAILDKLRPSVEK